MNESDERALSYRSAGPEAAPVMVFLHGWPDDPSMWDAQVQALQTRYRCILPCLPNYGDAAHEPGGMDFTEIVARLARTVEAVSPDPVILVTHDWGAYIGYLFEQRFPDRVRLMIAMDVGGHVQPSSVREGAMFVGYQWTLILLWCIGGVIPPLGNMAYPAFRTAPAGTGAPGQQPALALQLPLFLFLARTVSTVAA